MNGKIPERGYFGSSSKMLALTDDFISGIRQKCKERKLKFSFQKKDDYTTDFQIGYDLYRLSNNGTSASTQFLGTMKF